MSLRIRRGTDAQRLQITPDEGELIYTTNTKKLFIGDGIVSGGINIGSALAGTGLVFDIGTQTLQVTSVPGGSGIASVSADLNPALGGNLSLNNKNITGTGTIGIVGTMYASQGLGGDLALNTHSINGTGNISITGNLSVTGLGADLNLNTRNITGTGNITTSGTLSVTGLGADLSLNGHNINGTGNIATTGSITATNIGSGNLTITNNTISTSASPTIVTNTNSTTFSVRGLTDGVNAYQDGQATTIHLSSSRGTLTSPTNTTPGDSLSRIAFDGYVNGVDVTAGAVIASWDASANLSDQTPASNLYFFCNAGGTKVNLAVLTSRGVFNAPVIAPSSYSCLDVYPTFLAGYGAGSMIFDSTTKHFVGWNGTTWKQIDSNGTTSSYAQTIASASTIAPTQRITFVSGTTQILTITPPADMAIGASATFNATISGTTLTVTSVPTGTITVGSLISGSGVSTGTVIIANISGSGNGSTWTVSIGQILTPATAINAVGNSGGQLTLIPTGAWSTGTSGNIALASTAVPSKALIMTYDHNTTKWYPSY